MSKPITTQNECPECKAGLTDIDWGIIEATDNLVFQEATCCKCGCRFDEHYVYAYTEIQENT